MVAIKTQAIDAYRATRTERGKKAGNLVSAATIDKDLRHLRAVLKKAFKWGYLLAVPDFQFEREALKLPSYVTSEQFAAICAACDQATLPAGPGRFWPGRSRGRTMLSEPVVSENGLEGCSRDRNQ
jgi:hypothetical protein